MYDSNSPVDLPLDKFGKFIMENFRDRAIDNYQMLSMGKWKAPSLQLIQSQLEQFSEEQKEIIHKVVISCIDHGLHDLLFGLQEAHELGDKIEVFVDGVNLAEVSDGLHGELFTEDGWYHRFSKYGTQNEG
jgi:hypothetical protein